MAERPISDAGRRDALYRLYRPNVPGGNLSSDVHARGQNEGIRRALIALGLEPNEDAVNRRFSAMDNQRWDEQEEALARHNAERKREAKHG